MHWHCREENELTFHAEEMGLDLFICFSQSGSPVISSYLGQSSIHLFGLVEALVLFASPLLPSLLLWVSQAQALFFSPHSIFILIFFSSPFSCGNLDCWGI